MKGVDDEGSELQFQVRLETGNSVRARVYDFIVWCDIRLRLAVFLAIDGVIITIGLIHNGLDWLHTRIQPRLDGFH